MTETTEPPVLYSGRPEWDDITPIAQYETGNPVAPILYTDEYKDATSYFRAIVKAKEYSPRVLDLTLHIISMNPAHYTVWQYRWATLLALASNLLDEQTLMEAIATKHLKTYQVWHHRRLLLSRLKNPLPELLFISTNLQVDAKNYHTWAYRQWILSHFGPEMSERTWDEEMDFTEEMIDRDIRNNSAWHHRFFIVWLTGIREGERDRTLVLRRELNYVKTKISLAPTNLSAWNYLRGILDHTHTPYSALLEFVEPYTRPTLKPLRTEEVDLDNPRPGQGAQLPCVYAIEFAADAYAKSVSSSSTEERSVDEEAARSAMERFKSLAETYDKTRKHYWNYRISQLATLTQLQAQA